MILIYLDPGSGSFLLQLLIAAIAGLTVFVGSQVQKLLRSREDIFSEYTRTGFELAFGHWYTILSSSSIRDSDRWLYLMKRIRK